MFLQRIFFTLLFVGCYVSGFGQTFDIVDGDTINFTSTQGVKQGFWRYFWANGDLKYEVFYENNEKEGLEIRYY
jgi:hypothetical protein